MPGVTTSVSNAATRPPPMLGQQLLRENADDRRGELRANLILLIAWGRRR